MSEDEKGDQKTNAPKDQNNSTLLISFGETSNKTERGKGRDNVTDKSRKFFGCGLPMMMTP
jgi:hypothetical protein